MDSSVADKWRTCAVDYVDWWRTTDRQLIRSFSNQVTCTILADMASPNKYRVARTVPGYGEQKYKFIVDWLNSVRSLDLDRETVPRMIGQACIDLGERYGKYLPSILSKALWMVKGHPVVIYDSLAWEGLRRGGFSPGYQGYVRYFAAWFKFYDSEETQANLEHAVSSLVTSGTLGNSEFEELSVAGRLKNRIADVWLWKVGESARAKTKVRGFGSWR